MDHELVVNAISHDHEEQQRHLANGNLPRNGHDRHLADDNPADQNINDEQGGEEEQQRHQANGYLPQENREVYQADDNGPADIDAEADDQEEEEEQRRHLGNENGPADLIMNADVDDEEQQRHLPNDYLQLEDDHERPLPDDDVPAGLGAEGGYQDGDPPAVPAEGEGDAEGGGEQREEVDEEEVKRREERRKCRKLYMSIWGVSLAFMLVYACHHGVLNLEKILNMSKGRGHDTTAMLLGLSATSCIFAVIPVKVIGAKWVSFLGLGFITIFTALYYMPDSDYTNTVAAVVAGLATGPVWASQGRLVTLTAIRYGRLTTKIGHQDTFICQFTGIFFFLFQMAPTWENLAFSLQFVFRNDTIDLFSPKEQIGNLTCGRKNTRHEVLCNWGERRNECLVPFRDSALVTFCIVCILLFFGICGMTAVLLMGRKLTRSTEDSRNQMLVQRYFWLMVTKVPRMWGEWRLWPLILFIMFTGMQQAFIFIDFADSYAFCGTGSMWSGFVMATYGVCSGFTALAMGYIIPRVSRLCIVVVGAILNLAFLITLLLWTPTPYLLQKGLQYLDAPIHVPQNIAAFFVVIAGFGICDAIWQVFLNSLLGIMFYHKRTDVAFSNFRFFSIVGMSMAFAYRERFSVLVKLSLLIVTFIISLGLYGLFESRYRRVQQPLMFELDEDDAEDDEDDGEDREDDLRNPGAPWHPNPNINFEQIARGEGDDGEGHAPGIPNDQLAPGQYDDFEDEDDLDPDPENDPIVGHGVIYEDEEQDLLDRREVDV